MCFLYVTNSTYDSMHGMCGMCCMHSKGTCCSIPQTNLMRGLYSCGSEFKSARILMLDASSLNLELGEAERIGLDRSKQGMKDSCGCLDQDTSTVRAASEHPVPKIALLEKPEV